MITRGNCATLMVWRTLVSSNAAAIATAERAGEEAAAHIAPALSEHCCSNKRSNTPCVPVSYTRHKKRSVEPSLKPPLPSAGVHSAPGSPPGAHQRGSGTVPVVPRPSPAAILPRKPPPWPEVPLVAAPLPESGGTSLVAPHTSKSSSELEPNPES